MPLAPAVTVMKAGLLLVAVHAQVPPVVKTLTEFAPPDAAKFWLRGLMAYVQVAPGTVPAQKPA